jgi:hypothetical protein
MIIRLVLPELPRALQSLVDAIGCEGLPGVQNIGKSMPGQRLDQDMDMIGHDHMVIEDIPLSIEEPKSPVDDVGIPRLAQQAGATAGIQEVLITLGEEPVIFGEFVTGEILEIMRPFPPFSLFPHFINDCVG